MTPAYIALGSNLDAPAEQLDRAVTALAKLPGCELDRVSSVYRSAAVGPGDQPDYLNAVARMHTRMSAHALLDSLQRIEQEQGRIRDTRWGPRTLDLDILLFGDETISTARLSVPHPQIPQRHFVLYPLCEISGEQLVFPDGTELSALLRRCSSDGLVKTPYQLKANASSQCHKPDE
jgi:2-amino-4-hydroxy-6-hydroxymethyldihydropteridine diphosphokinase